MLPRVFSTVSFNSQPPEGGWKVMNDEELSDEQFQLTAARRRLEVQTLVKSVCPGVSTHSRPKAAG